MIPTRLKLLKFLLNQLMASSKGTTLGFACKMSKGVLNSLLCITREGMTQLITFNAYHKLEKQHAWKEGGH